MEPRRFSGKTVEEATDNALETLDANLEDVEIVVVNPGRSGILGFGGEPAEIDVVLLDAGASGRSFDSSSEPDDDKVVKLTIDNIEKKRDELGINEKKERKLYDMEDRRALSID